MARDEVEEKALIEVSQAQRRGHVMRPANVEPAVWALATDHERALIVRHERLHEIIVELAYHDMRCAP